MNGTAIETNKKQSSTAPSGWKPVEQGRYLFTVFTSAYNREKKIPRVYESMKSQTFRDFEWLIVDDGSVDNTRELVEKWQKEADFPIRYFWKENGGHHSAFNLGVQKAQGTLFLQLDSDDACFPNALEVFANTWNNLPAPKEQYAGITGLCVDQDGALIGDLYPRDIMDSTSLEMHYRFHVKGEKWGFTRTDLLRSHPFPIVEGVKWFPPNVVWYAIGRKYKTRYINQKLRTYYMETAQKSDQAAYFPVKKVAPGISYLHRTVLNEDIDKFSYSPKDFLRFAVHYGRFSLHAGRSFGTQYRELNNGLARTLWFLGLPLGMGLYIKDQSKVRKQAQKS
ncbi:glycosyltransferase family 2 protein [Leptospirillum ferriphilum]|uniref:glycosyltransferase family 2 protein n=1 Tax=Leptospirillum ferriphilum TaxID=178606 RepID=UPI0006B22E92|nr:glycosyltransferase family 2 protein [Leptospirillum ferriphilum]